MALTGDPGGVLLVTDREPAGGAAAVPPGWALLVTDGVVDLRAAMRSLDEPALVLVVGRAAVRRATLAARRAFPSARLVLADGAAPAGFVGDDRDAGARTAARRVRRHLAVLADGAYAEVAASAAELVAVAADPQAAPLLEALWERGGEVLAVRHPLATPVASDGLGSVRAIDPAYRDRPAARHELDPGTGFATWLARHEVVADPPVDGPLISIVMPVYDTDPDVLRTTVGSVLAQRYPRWQLCICDDRSPSAATQAALAELAAADDRIVTVRREANGGIVAASNDALALATGEYVGLLDHDDLLEPDALAELVRFLQAEPELDFVYSDEYIVAADGRPLAAFLKPAWSRSLLECVNYVTHFAVYRRTILEEVGGFREGFDGSQDYDLALRVTERTDRIGHLAMPIYGWRQVAGSTADRPDAKPYAFEAARKALAEALQRNGEEGTVEDGLVPYTYRTRRKVRGRPRVSIVVPTRNGARMLARCLSSIDTLSTWDDYEFVIVDNQTDEADALALFGRVGATVVPYPHPFNYARQMNLGIEAAHGDLVLMLNNDTVVRTPGWIEAMIEHAQRPGVGAVGCRLVFPGGEPQHEGVALRFGPAGIGNVVWFGYYALGRYVRDVTAVTAACLMMRPEVFWAVGGFDEGLRVAYNDVDLCLKVRAAGYDVVYTPFAELVHDESATRRSLHPEADTARFAERWGDPLLARDPFYNANLANDPVVTLRR